MNEVRQSSAKVFISSNTETTWSVAGSNSQIECKFAPFILRSNDTTHFVVGIECLSIPLAIYTVNVYNNTLVTDAITTTIPVGNYTATTIQTYLNTQTATNGVAWALNTTTNCFAVTFIGTKAFTGSASVVLGYYDSATPISSGNLIKTINLAYTTGVQIRLDNIQTDNRDSQTGTSSILVRVPITVAPFKVLQYFNSSPFYTTIANRYINSFKVSLLDDDYRLLDLVGNPQWNMTLRVDFADKVESVTQKKLIDETINGNMLTSRKI
jgi:hypothetical protein